MIIQIVVSLNFRRLYACKDELDDRSYALFPMIRAVASDNR